ncbi:MAG TPA: tRNA-(ms[2]io[6]A)-hydroxylase [Polyangiaceae bacterium]|jgi:tRNA-(ms[2]io[6]A)-hydroxylase|nr:tRNA-(ms[2]io[6]A)-hydroxylase [Polyangiaceae bacterium]
MPREKPPSTLHAFTVLAPTSAAWIDAVRSDFDAFLRDHAACERKASATAMTLASHYRDKEELVTEMVDLACEELHHFRKVYAFIVTRGGQLGEDTKDRYVRELLGLARRAPEVYLLDRLLVAGVIEARGCERFGLLAASLEPELAAFYGEFARSEGRHAGLFVRLAKRYYDEPQVDARLAELFAAEAPIVQSLPLRAALH